MRVSRIGGKAGFAPAFFLLAHRGVRREMAPSKSPRNRSKEGFGMDSFSESQATSRPCGGVPPPRVSWRLAGPVGYRREFISPPKFLAAFLDGRSEALHDGTCHTRSLPLKHRSGTVHRPPFAAQRPRDPFPQQPRSRPSLRRGGLRQSLEGWSECDPP